MKLSAAINAATQIIKLASDVIDLVHRGEGDETTPHKLNVHLDSIKQLADAAKPEIQGYSEHE